MPKYTCKHKIYHDGNEYNEGDTIDLSLEQAQKMSDALEPYMHSEEDKPQPKKKKGGE